MRKLYFLLLMIFVSSVNYAQNCDCSSNLKWLIETFEKNDAGFQYVIDEKGKDTYFSHNKVFIEKATKIKRKKVCLKLLNDWTYFFRKNHLEVVLNENTYNLNNQKQLSDKEILRIYKDSPKFEIREKDFEKYVSNLNIKNGFEGIWLTEGYKIGIIKDEKNTSREYIGFVLKSESPYWKPNQVKLEIFKDENGTYNMKYYMKDHSIKEIENVEITGNNYLLANFIILKRIKPEIKTDSNSELYFESKFADKPFLKKISENTLLLRIASFNHSMKKEIDSLLTVNNDLISKTDNLIIDLRNNGGGSDASYEKIIPYLYTNPIRDLGVQYLSTELNNKRMVDFIDDPEWSKEDKEWAKKGLEKLNNNIGDFVNLEDEIVSIDTLGTILPYPKNVGILINGNCGSTTEQFLLTAKQSKKTKLLGTTTIGSLDISNMYFTNSPCGEYKLWYGLTKSYRIPEMLIDGKGIQPDFYFDKTIEPYDWIKKTEEILNYE